MNSPRMEFGRERSTCDCEKCLIGCVTIPGYLIPADIPRLMAATNTDNKGPFEWAEEHLLASFGAGVGRIMDDGRIVIKEVKTLVPATHAIRTSSCHWLSGDGKCTVHEVSPYGCAFFKVCCTKSRREVDAASLDGMNDILRDEKEKGLYSQIHAHLALLKRIAEPIQIRKERMAFLLSVLTK